jgi:hypothetical protein
MDNLNAARFFEKTVKSMLYVGKKARATVHTQNEAHHARE